MTVTLVTGGNRGIGYEIARAVGGTVLVGARDPGRGDEAQRRLRAAGVDAHHLPLDVTDAASVAAAAATVEHDHGELDVLVNNAALATVEWTVPPSAVDIDLTRQMFETNVIGLVAVTNAMLPLLRKAKAARIVNMSSRLGSMTTTRDWDDPAARMNLLAYNASKAAVHSLTVAYATELRDTSIKVNAVNPGFCGTDAADDFVTAAARRPAGMRTAAEGARVAVLAAHLDDSGPTGTFFDEHGPLPW